MHCPLAGGCNQNRSLCWINWLARYHLFAGRPLRHDPARRTPRGGPPDRGGGGIGVDAFKVVRDRISGVDQLFHRAVEIGSKHAVGVIGRRVGFGPGLRVAVGLEGRDQDVGGGPDVGGAGGGKEVGSLEMFAEPMK